MPLQKLNKIKCPIPVDVAQSIKAALHVLHAGLLKYNPTLSSTSTPQRERIKRAALWVRNARLALPIPTPVYREEKKNIGSNLTLIYTDTHTKYTHTPRRARQCSPLYQRLSHTNVMGHSPGSQFGLFFLFWWKQGGVAWCSGVIKFIDLD